MSHAFSRAGIKTPALKPILRRGWGALSGFDVDVREAEKTWQRLRAATPKTGLYPLIVGDGHGNLLDESMSENVAPDATLRAAERINAAEWFEQRMAESAEDGNDLDFGEDDEDVEDSDQFTQLDGGEYSLKQAHILLVPTSEPWKVFAYLEYGGWNAYPAAEEHVAVMKSWHERFGAEPFQPTAAAISGRDQSSANSTMIR